MKLNIKLVFLLVFLSYPGKLQKKCLDSKSFPLGLLIKLWSRPKLSKWTGNLQVLTGMGRNTDCPAGKGKKIVFTIWQVQKNGWFSLYNAGVFGLSYTFHAIPSSTELQPMMLCNYGCWKRASDLPGERNSRTYPVPVVLVGALCCPGDQQPRKRPKSPWKRQH